VTLWILMSQLLVSSLISKALDLFAPITISCLVGATTRLQTGQLGFRPIEKIEKSIHFQPHDKSTKRLKNM